MTPTLPEDAPALVNAIPQLESEPPAEVFAQGHAALIGWGAVALLVALALAVLWWVRRVKRVQPPAPTPLETALAHLSELEAQLPPLRECGLQVSLIIRQYLQGAVQDPALYETHEEFSRRMDSLAAVPEECRYDTRYLLEQLADLKYAGVREQAPEQARLIIEQATALLRRIQEIQQQTAANSPTA